MTNTGQKQAQDGTSVKHMFEGLQEPILIDFWWIWGSVWDPNKRKTCSPGGWFLSEKNGSPQKRKKSSPRGYTHH